MADLYYLPQNKQTSLQVPGGITAGQTTGIILANTDDVDTDKPGLICVNFADPLDTDTAEFITYTSIDGSNELQGVVRAAEGIAAKAHDNGAIVGFVVSKSHINNINNKLTGVDTTVVSDTNGNEILVVTQTASAVNYVRLNNSATGTPVEIQAQGGDSNIGIHLQPKGTGYVHLERAIGIEVFAPDVDIETGDGKKYFRIPNFLGGYNLIDIEAQVVTAATGSGSETIDIQIYNVTQATDMLSTVLTIDEDETDSSTAATAAVIDTNNDDVSAGDQLRIDIDAVPSTTAGSGLVVELIFRLP